MSLRTWWHGWSPWRLRGDLLMEQARTRHLVGRVQAAERTARRLLEDATLFKAALSRRDNRPKHESDLASDIIERLAGAEAAIHAARPRLMPEDLITINRHVTHLRDAWTRAQAD